MSTLKDYILNHSTNIIVQKLEEVLKTFQADIFEDAKTTNYIADKVEVAGTRIGEPSAFGSLWEIEDEDIVVKVIEVCPDEVNLTSFQKNICSVAKNDNLVFHIPNTISDKYTLLSPNILSELLISIILGQGPIQKISPNFTKTFGVQYDKSNPQKPHAFIVMEKLSPLDDYIHNAYDVLWYMFGVAWGLSQAQALHRYVHFDLHGQNIMARPHNISKLVIYDIGDGRYLHSRQPFDAVIIDYGHNRLETESHVIIPRTVFDLGADDRPDINDFYAFNPYIDMFTAINQSLCMLPAFKIAEKKIPPHLILSYKPICEELLSYFFNLDAKTSPFTWIYDNKILFKGHWRPRPEKLAQYDLPHLPPKLPSDMYKFIVDKFEALQIKHDLIKLYIDDPDYAEHVAKYMRSAPMVADRKLTELVGLDGITDYVVYEAYKPNTSQMYFPIYTVPDQDVMNSYKFAGGNINIKTVVVQNKKILGHHAYINQRELIKKGFKWHFDCCRMIIQDVLRQPNIDGGISINASFFRLRDNFEPLGFYKANNVIINNPSDDENRYGVVYVKSNGLLDITYYTKKMADNIDRYDQILSVGPMLVWDDTDVTGNLCDATKYDQKSKKNVKVYNCRQPKDNNEKLDNPQYFNDGMANCSNIKPGSLAHACQKNPRSAIFVTDKGEVGMLYIEGRGARGDGATLMDLAKLCLMFNASRAINLDGGGSSQLIWKMLGKNFIYQTNPSHNFTYPVGSTLSFIKKL